MSALIILSEGNPKAGEAILLPFNANHGYEPTKQALEIDSAVSSGELYPERLNYYYGSEDGVNVITPEVTDTVASVTPHPVVFEHVIVPVSLALKTGFMVTPLEELYPAFVKAAKVRSPPAAVGLSTTYATDAV
jgi:hypothetical protein